MSFITFVGDRDSPRYCQPGVLQLTLPLLRVCLGHWFRVQRYFQLGMAKLIYFCHYFLSDFCLFVCFIWFVELFFFFSLSFVILYSVYSSSANFFFFFLFLSWPLNYKYLSACSLSTWEIDTPVLNCVTRTPAETMIENKFEPGVVAGSHY